MGPAIYLWVERQLPSGEWEMVKRQEDRVRSSGHWRSLQPQTADQHELLSLAATCSPMYNWELGKNHNLPAILAGHWNSESGRQFTDQFISPPRGLPSDLSEGVLEDSVRGPFRERWSRAQRLKALSQKEPVAPSWVTLRELLAVDWDAATHGQGVRGEGGDFVTILKEEIVPIGPPECVRLVFYFDS